MEPCLCCDCETSEVDPVGNRVHPCEEYDRPGNELVERNILVKVDDTVEWGLSKKRY